MTTQKKTADIPEADNGRRDNEEIKGRIDDLITRKGDALKQALALIKQAEALLSFRHSTTDDATYERAVHAVWGASREVDKAMDFNFNSDCYLGNKACGPLGAAILRDMESGILPKSK